MVYKRIFIALLIFTGIIGIYSFVNLNDDPLLRIKQQLASWTNDAPVEKVYLQLDKPYYAAGDDLWFKAYVVSGGNHQPTSLSGVLNIELTDDRDSVKQSVKLPLVSGLAHGDFALPDTLHQGRYHIRAYTQYMRNAGSDYFFNQPVTIINTITPVKVSKSKVTITQPVVNKTDVQFFPESGYLVAGISTKVAFKAIGPNGLGTAVSGIVIADKGYELAHIASTHLGMGVFEITPVAGVNYEAKIVDANGVESMVKLPRVIDKGFVMNITDTGPQNLHIKITASKGIPANEQPLLLAQSGGKVCYSEKIQLGSAPFTALIPKSKFPSGITQFTLCSAAGEPLNERLVFIRHNDQIKLSITSDQQVYSPRQKVKFTLNAQSTAHQPITGNFSVSVIDENRVPVNEDEENNIFASLLLTSDLRGYVEQPAYYFNHNDAKTTADLDVLMLTQGYHRFEWKELLNNARVQPLRFADENSLQVSGTVTTPGGKPVARANVKLYDLDSILFARETTTDEHGHFAFKNLSFDDSVRFIVQARTERNKKDVDIKMDKLPPVIMPAYNGLTFQSAINGNLSTYTQSSKQLYDEERKYGLGNHVFTLQEVEIREKKELFKYSANLNGAGNADQVIFGKTLHDLGCINVTDCLEGRLLGVIFRGGVAYTTRGYGRMQVIVDGAYVESSYLNILNYTDIQSIEVLRNVGLTAIYGSRGGNGVLLVTTRHGGDDDDEPQPIYGRGITTYFPKGYYKAREFYSPRYNNPQTNKQLADLRTTIFWKPDVVTGTDGKTSFEYFNAGSKGTYRVSVEGIDSEGHLGRQVYRYQVQ